MNSQQVLQDAFNLHQRGQLDQAQSLYRKVIDADPKNHRALHLLGVLQSQRGNQREAIALIGRSLEIDPKDFAAHSNYGLALAAADRHDDAIASYDRSLAIKPNFQQARYNRGIALAELGRFEEAVISFDAVLTQQPKSAPCYYNRGLSLASLNRLEEALASYDTALMLDPKLVSAWDNRGIVLHALGRYEDALVSHTKAVSIDSKSFRAHYNRGTVLAMLKRHEEAIASYDASVEINSGFLDAWINRGNSLATLERFSEAESSFDAALSIHAADIPALSGKATTLRRTGRIAQSLSICEQILATHQTCVPVLMAYALALYDASRYPDSLAEFDRLLAIESDNAEAWNGRGATLHAMKRNADALNCFKRAIELKPDLPDALNNRAHLSWTGRNDYVAAIADLTKSIAIEPNQPLVHGELLHIKMQCGDWVNFEQDKRLLDAGIRAGKAVLRPFVYQALSTNPADLQKCSRLFAAKCFPQAFASPAPARVRHKKIRLGYVSGEFKEQATAYLMAGLYEHHDRDRFEVIAIDNTLPDASPMRRRLESAFDKMFDISQLPDDVASNLIRAEEIDILVNLNGYFGSARTGLFARRSAPIQVNYLGFPATLGTNYMDYIIADRVVIPDDERQYYDEQVVWLPHCYQANDNKRSIAQSIPGRASVGLPEDAFVYCNFNQAYKLTPDVFASWMRILRKTVGSVLWLLESNSFFAENLRRAAAQHGVSGDRLVFARPIVSEEHLSRLRYANLFLDTLPYNAHTTASDALWAGVPVLTCRGTTFPGRVGASILGAIGLPELVKETMEQYEEAAIQLAHDRKTLTALRHKLETHRLSHPLFDTDLFRKYIEAAYAKMWASWVDGLFPSGFAVPPDLTQPILC